MGVKVGVAAGGAGGELPTEADQFNVADWQPGCMPGIPRWTTLSVPVALVAEENVPVMDSPWLTVRVKVSPLIASGGEKLSVTSVVQPLPGTPVALKLVMPEPSPEMVKLTPPPPPEWVPAKVAPA